MYTAWVCWMFCQRQIITDHNPELELRQTVAVGGAPTRIYETPGFLDPPDSYSVWQEHTILPGLVWITELHREDSDEDIKIDVLDRQRFRCTFVHRDISNNRNPAQVHIVTLAVR